MISLTEDMVRAHQHIVASDGSNSEFPFGFACLHCGEKKQIATPILLIMWIEFGRVFMGKHRSCKRAS